MKSGSLKDKSRENIKDTEITIRVKQVCRNKTKGNQETNTKGNRESRKNSVY